jgi:hypothetical protein
VSDVSDQRRYYERMMDEIAIEHRQKVDQLQAENVKLRDEFRKMDQWHSTELMAALDENAQLREACAELLEMAESHDPEWLHWPEMYEELRKLGVEV